MVAGAQLTIGQYGMLTRAVQQFTWRLEGIMRSLGTLHEESLYLGDLYEFFSLVAPEESAGPADAICRCASSRCPSAIRAAKQCWRKSTWKFARVSGSR